MIAHGAVAEHAALAAVAVMAVAAYGWGWTRTSRPSTARLASWVGGVGALALAVSPPVERWAQDSFTGHMVQHLLMIVVAAPLLVLAAPVRVARALPGAPRPSPVERRAGRWWRANGAVAAAGLFVAVLFVTHLTGIYDGALGNRALHDGEHVAYVASAVLLWSGIGAAGRRAAPARIGAVFGVIAGSALLGVVLLTASEPLMDTYADRLGRADALADQRVAASLMWVGGMALTVPLLLVSVWRWAGAEQRAAERAEALAQARSGVTAGSADR